MNPVQKSVLAAIADAMADKRQQARIRYHLYKHNMQLHLSPGLGPLVICRTTQMVKFQGTLHEVEAFAKGGAR